MKLKQTSEFFKGNKASDEPKIKNVQNRSYL